MKMPLPLFTMYTINPEIFRLYDIRGIYPADINRDVVYAISRAFMQFLKKEMVKENLTICIGRDARPSSQEFFEAFAWGVHEEGGKVIDIGLSMTPALYFAVDYLGYDGGVNITASHNPNPFNGLKLVRREAVPIGGENGLQDIRARTEHLGFLSCPLSKPQDIEKKEITSLYIEETLRTTSHVLPAKWRGIAVAIDTGNGAAGPFVEALLEHAPSLRAQKIYFEPDGNFPHHIPDPLIKENIGDLIALVKKDGLACGIAFDGDGDRIIFVDERGTPVRGDVITAFMAKRIVAHHPGVKILFDIRSSRAVEEAMQNGGGVPVRYRVGHVLIKEKMRKDDIFFAGELSGHYYLGKPMYYEVPFFVMLSVLDSMNESGKSLSDLLAPFTSRWHHSGEINFEVEDKSGTIERVAAQFSDGEVSRMDGLRVDYPEWWFNVRPSNTEPLLRLVVEADSERKLQEKVAHMREIIEQ